jgi:hypothetical protein
MRLWLGIGEHEIQIDFKGQELELRLPWVNPPCEVECDGIFIDPSRELESAREFNLIPLGPGVNVEGYRLWRYWVKYMWENPSTKDSELCLTCVDLCRDDDGSWGMVIHPESGTAVLVNIPEATTKNLESTFRTFPDLWPFTPVVVQGGGEES